MYQAFAVCNRAMFEELLAKHPDGKNLAKEVANPEILNHEVQIRSADEFDGYVPVDPDYRKIFPDGLPKAVVRHLRTQR